MTNGTRLKPLIFGILVGLVFVTHHILVLNPNYAPLNESSYYDERSTYAPKINAFIKNDPILPSVFPTLPPILMGSLGKVIGLRNIVIISDFIFPFLIFLLLYKLMTFFTQNALLFSTVFMFLPKLFVFALDSPFQGLYFSQFYEPKITFLFFLVSLMSIILALKDDRFVMLAGVSTGLLFYTYLYDWVTIFCALGLLFLFGIQRKKILKILLVGLLVGSVYFYNLSLLQHLPKDYSNKFLWEFSHNFRWAIVWKSYIRNIVLIFALWWLKPKHYQFLVALLTSYFVVMNMQLFTGFNLQPDHWFRIQFLPVTLAIIAIIPFTIKKEWILALATISVFFTGQVFYTKAHAQEFMISPPLKDTYQWINNNLSKKTIGVLDYSLNNGILMETDSNIFLPSGFNTIISDEELWGRLETLAKLEKLTSQEFLNQINVFYLFGDKYGDKRFNAVFTAYKREIPQNILQNKVREYSNLQVNNKPDYLISKKELDFEQVFNNGEYIIYKL